jgi:hypothetical protein
VPPFAQGLRLNLSKVASQCGLPNFQAYTFPNPSSYSLPSEPMTTHGGTRVSAAFVDARHVRARGAIVQDLEAGPDNMSL